MRRRLFLVTLAVTTLLVAAFAFPLARLVGEVARDRAITDAERDLAAVTPVLAVEPERSDLEAAVESTASGQAGRLSVLLPDDAQVGDPTAVDPEAVALARDGRAFSRSTSEGVDVYSPVVLTDATVVLRVRVPDELLSDGVATSWAMLALVAVALLAGSVAATDRLARSVTRPAAALARTSRDLARGDTTARAEVVGPPEIVAVADALNLLADRISELLRTERERVADLSHRLRTPLTALRLDAEGHGATALLEDVDRLEAEVSELIRAARRPLHAGVFVRADLAAVAADRAAFWGALADDDGRAWTCTVEPDAPAVVCLSASDAAAAVDVLLGNVFAHTQVGTTYEVSVTAGTGRVVLAVDDAGGGIDDAAVVLDRGASAAGSTGLGLDIAAATARAAGGELHVKASHLGGARIELDLPLVDDSR